MHGGGSKNPFDGCTGGRAVAEGTRLGTQLREKVTELMVRVEHLQILVTPEGLSIFGTICEMAGKCCQHLAAGRREQALQVAKTVGRSVPHAFPVGAERASLEDALEEIIALLESPDVDQFH